MYYLAFYVAVVILIVLALSWWYRFSFKRGNRLKP